MISRIRVEAHADSRPKVISEINTALLWFMKDAGQRDNGCWVATDDGVWAERFPQTHPTKANQLTGYYKGRRVIVFMPLKEDENAVEGGRGESPSSNAQEIREEAG